MALAQVTADAEHEVEVRVRARGKKLGVLGELSH